MSSPFLDCRRSPACSLPMKIILCFRLSLFFRHNHTHRATLCRFPYQWFLLRLWLLANGCCAILLHTKYIRTSSNTQATPNASFNNNHLHTNHSHIIYFHSLVLHICVFLYTKPEIIKKNKREGNLWRSPSRL